jgi:hypothetical protein
MKTSKPVKLEWLVLKNYSIEAQLQIDGLTFQSFETIRQSLGDSAVDSIQKKIVGRMAKGLRTEGLESVINDEQEFDGPDIAKIRSGCYVISVCNGFEIDYSNDSGERSSRVLYIGSGSVYNRIKSHLSEKLFEFSSTLPSVPLRFSIVELPGHDEEKGTHKAVEQMLLAEFAQRNGGEFPLLNKNNAHLNPPELDLEKGWELPLQKDKGKKTTDWVLKPADRERFKGAY